MENDLAAIKACYSDYRRVKGRKVLQLIFEVPLEQAPMVHDAFGEPSPDGSTWVGIAKIDLTARPEERKPLKLSNRAAMLCNDEPFQKYIDDETAYDGLTVENCAAAIRMYCGIQSRSELDTDDRAAAAFRKLEADYDHWLRAA